MTVVNGRQINQIEIGPYLIATALNDGSWVGNLDPDIELAQQSPPQADIFIPAQASTSGFQEAVLRPQGETSANEGTEGEAVQCRPEPNSFILRAAGFFAPLRETPPTDFELRNMDALYQLGNQEAARTLNHFQECLAAPGRLRILSKSRDGVVEFLHQPYSKSPEAKYRGRLEIIPGSSPLQIQSLILETGHGQRLVLRSPETLSSIPGVEDLQGFRKSLLRLWVRG